ncbi:MAG: nitrous oxide-stimulated promoter family protein [Dehalococcoidia bacterium]|nr:MAG: nitrous oxide-stimulated promoter family protein [Dehalococcoidia bacterium]
MPKLFDRLTPKNRKDLRVLGNFINVYCRENHKEIAKQAFYIADEDLQIRLRGLNLCSDCSRLLEHGIAKLSLCPYDPRPSCRKCKTHCYAPGYREKVRQVMRFSGTYLIKHGRLDLLLHYLT